MAMFDKPAGTDGVSSPGTVVGANVKLTGTLKDVNDITVHGQVDGEIISDRIVTVAETAKVKGPVTATSVTIAGLVNGAVNASERCELLPSARVTGSITTSDLSIRSGALFNGKATMAEPSATDKAALMKSADVEPEPGQTPTADEQAVELTESAATETTIAESAPESPTPTPDVTPAEPTAELED